MPDGIYLDALALGPERLAQKMSEIISNQSQYYEMFRWRRHYSYHSPDEHPDSDAVCIFCAYLNKDRNFQDITMYSDTLTWLNECKNRPQVFKAPEIQLENEIKCKNRYQVFKAPETQLENKLKYDPFLADELDAYYVQ